MEARKCDRCGKLYENYSLSIPGDPIKGGGNYRVNGFKTGTDSCMNTFKDLCPECMSEFIEWFNKPRAEGAEEAGGQVGNGSVG